MIGMLAAVCRIRPVPAMLDFSLRDDPMRAQLTMKNRVLLTSILILSYGIYVPKSWRRAALVVGPLAILPFATLLVLYLRHPRGDGVAGADGVGAWGRPRVALFGFDAMILLILAVGSAIRCPARSPGFDGRSPRPGSSASIASGGGSAPEGWARSTWPSTSS